MSRKKPTGRSIGFNGTYDTQNIYIENQKEMGDSKSGGSGRAKRLDKGASLAALGA